MPTPLRTLPARVFALLVIPALFALPADAARPKALFDNAHAETSGNSDWQIDTDQPVPLPDQALITSATPRDYWLGGISSWAVDLVKRGYEVATNVSAITYGNASNPYDLSKWDVFVLPEPNTRFSAAESTAILSYVREGGGLIVVVDHYNSDRNGDGIDSPRIWNAFDPQKLLGVHWQVSGEPNNNIVQDSGNVEGSATDSIIHGPNGVADSLAFHNGDTMVLDPVANPRVRGLVWMNGLAHGTTGVMAARSEYGDGRVVFAGDSSPIDDGSAVPGNSSIYDGWGEASGRDSLFFLNATMWATRRPAPEAGVTGLTAGLGFAAPAPNPAGTPVRFSVTMPAAGEVRIDMLDAGGRLVREVTRARFEPGTGSVIWDGRDAHGLHTPPGVYFARLVTRFGTITRQVVRLK